MTDTPLHRTTDKLLADFDPEKHRHAPMLDDGPVGKETGAPHKTTLPQLHGWQFQPDQDAPGLYLQCATLAQRETIMRALGWYPGCPEYRSDTPNGLQSA